MGSQQSWVPKACLITKTQRKDPESQSGFNFTKHWSAATVWQRGKLATAMSKPSNSHATVITTHLHINISSIVSHFYAATPVYIIACFNYTLKWSIFGQIIGNAGAATQQTTNKETLNKN